MQFLAENITLVQEFVIRQVRQPIFYYWFKLSGQIRRHKRLTEQSQAIILKYIKERQASAESNDDLLDMLISARYKDTGQGMTDQQLIDESLILFLAGHENTANALTWMWYLLGQHETVVQRLLKSFEEQMGSRKPSVGDLRQLPYLQQVIEESMRLYPPAWITDRVALEADEVAGYHIPKGTLVLPYIYGIHHDPDLWDNPERFDPDRFAPEPKAQIAPFTYLPFGGGPRLCIGNNFAIMEMQLILIEMLRRYKIEPVEPEKVTLKPLITLQAEQGVWVRVKAR